MINWKARILAPSWGLLAIVGLVAAGMWVWQNGPDSVSPREYDRSLRAETYDAARQARLQIISARRNLGWDLEYDSWTQNVVPVVVADHRAGQALSMRWPLDSDIDVVERETIDELMSHPKLQRVTSEEIAIGVHAVRSSMPEGIASTRDGASVMGTWDGVDYCVTVASYSDDFIDRGTFPEYATGYWYRGGDRGARSSFLGGCTFAHRYGLPGQYIRGWLEEHGAPRPRASGFSIYGAIDLPISEGFELESIFINGDFGRQYGLVRRVCAAGDTSQCLREFDPDSDGFSAATGPSVVENRGSTTVLRGMQGDLLSHLEYDFGEKAFLAFWTSDLPFEQAFESAFGMAPAEWTRREVLEISGPVRAGPFPIAGSMFSSAWLALLAVLLGIFFTRRRTI